MQKIWALRKLILDAHILLLQVKIQELEIGAYETFSVK